MFCLKLTALESKDREKNLLWSLHMSTAYLSWSLNILKNTAVYSFKSFEAKTSNPNGPSAPLTDEPNWLQSNCGLVKLESRTSAFSNRVTANDISTSACKICHSLYVYISCEYIVKVIYLLPHFPLHYF